MDFRHIRLELSPAAVATITLDRPDTLNALNAEMLDELRAAVESLPGAGARCLLIVGEGRGFSSGADLASGGGLPDDAGLALERHFNPLVETLFALPIPVVAAVNGPAAGAGCSLALAADIVIAARSAYFLQAFVNIGLIPDCGATWLLPRLAGRARAMEMMMLGERIGAEQAEAWGMISRVVDDADLAPESVALATRLAQGPTIALGLIRRLARDSAQLPLQNALAAERVAQREAGWTEDFKAAVLAFLQKRQPRFEGR
ncbi:enoyl-CoA hydratase-related protein [Sphingosinicella sp. CPCC 101087]|uniref:enoyl-CoA hydratase-related protein n=1 Tax=Sphingosinicella sp. CPCC 101087 TaxID=2497754 RepID=UPI00101D78F3|nr:enoyl-CoA hydratase-related protein [Sphingosinicella sp. CPCC 101087]